MQRRENGVVVFTEGSTPDDVRDHVTIEIRNAMNEDGFDQICFVRNNDGSDNLSFECLGIHRVVNVTVKMAKGDTMPKTLEQAKEMAKKKAYADLIGASFGPFDAIQWMRTLPKEWQDEIEDVIAIIYHEN